MKMKCLPVLLVFLLTGCKDLYPTLETIDVSLADETKSFSVNQEIKVNISGYIDSLLYDKVNISFGLAMKAEANGEDYTERGDFLNFSSTTSIYKGSVSAMFLGEDDLGDINHNFSFTVAKSGYYELWVGLEAYGRDFSKLRVAYYSKHIRFTVR